MLAYFVEAIPSPIAVTLFAAALMAVRYGVIAGGALGLVQKFAGRLAAIRIQNLPFTRAQLLREFGFSMLTVALFAALAGVGAWATGSNPIARASMPDGALEWLGAAVLVPVALLLHDFYFYWMHRAIHISWIYPYVHRVHHLSTNPSPLAALAFHPLEALVEALAVVLIVSLVPLPLPSLVAFGLLAFSFNVLGHLGYELVPPRLLASRVGRWINSSTSHNLHHRAFRYNFGLYTLIWDRFFGTIDPRYDAGLRARIEGRAV